MLVDKETILNFLREQGEHDQARTADAELPGQVDTERDSARLEEHGVNPRELIGKLGGGGLPRP